MRPSSGGFDMPCRMWAACMGRAHGHRHAIPAPPVPGNPRLAATPWPTAWRSAREPTPGSNEATQATLNCREAMAPSGKWSPSSPQLQSSNRHHNNLVPTCMQLLRVHAMVRRLLRHLLRHGRAQRRLRLRRPGLCTGRGSGGDGDALNYKVLRLAARRGNKRHAGSSAQSREQEA